MNPDAEARRILPFDTPAMQAAGGERRSPPRAPAGPAWPDDFAAALLDPAQAAPARLKSWNGSDPAQRFAIHRNNVTVSLIDALADTFPVVQALVGGDFFRALAREFVRTAPPASPVLAWYGEEFPAFVAGFAPAAGVPYLADVARLEYARVLAFHAADAAPVAGAAVAAPLAEPATLPGLAVRFVPGCALLRSPWAIASLWAAHQGDDEAGALSRIDPATPENALVCRRGLDVEVRALTAGDAAFVAALMAGAVLGDAVVAGAGEPGFDLPAALGLLLAADAIAGFIAARQGEEK